MAYYEKVQVKIIEAEESKDSERGISTFFLCFSQMQDSEVCCSRRLNLEDVEERKRLALLMELLEVESREALVGKECRTLHINGWLKAIAHPTKDCFVPLSGIKARYYTEREFSHGFD